MSSGKPCGGNDCVWAGDCVWKECSGERGSGCQPPSPPTYSRAEGQLPPMHTELSCMWASQF